MLAQREEDLNPEPTYSPKIFRSVKKAFTSPAKSDRLPEKTRLPSISSSNIFHKQKNSTFKTRIVATSLEMGDSDIIKSNNPNHSFGPFVSPHRTIRWEVLDNGVSRPKFVEENEYRGPRTKIMLQEFLEVKERVYTASGKERVELEDKVLRLSERILDVHGISLNIQLTSAVDSVLDLRPCKDRNQLIYGLLVLVPEVCRFPYSFYAKLDLICITICGSVSVLKPEYTQTIEKRLLNGTFPFGMFETEGQILHHFYKMLVFLMKCVVINFDQKLTRVAIVEKSKKTLMDSVHLFVKESIKSKRDCGSLGDQAKILHALTSRCNVVLNHKNESVVFKGRKIMEIMESIDSEGIDYNFWLKAGMSSQYGTLHTLAY